MILAARGVSVRRANHVALRAFALELSAGEIVAVLGPSGAGKSTLLDALSGMIPHAGTVVLDGRDVSAEPAWKRARGGLGYVPQGPSVLGDLSVGENLGTFAKLAARGGSPSAVATEVGLDGKLDVLARDLSGGERRRLELARALVAAPRVLLCDEPFAGLAPRDLFAIASVLRARAAAGLAVVVSDHHVEEALALARRALLLVDGAIVAETPASAFLAHPDVIARYAGRGGSTVVSPA